ncbi:hypothetical protein [Tumebacillus lipolyticus]|uniref:Uncharacterized protein n=1 Tax=Tumebacillus lipolyticus TaxID=1280370 RepID=A0ABW4ZUQ1_9BACL
MNSYQDPRSVYPGPVITTAPGAVPPIVFSKLPLSRTMIDGAGNEIEYRLVRFFPPPIPPLFPPVGLVPPLLPPVIPPVFPYPPYPYPILF